MKKAYLSGSLVLLAACSAAPPVSAPVPVVKALAYAVPASSTAAYAFSDSSSFDIQAGAIGNIHVSIASAGVADVTYAAASAAALQATVHVSKLAGSMTNSQMGGGPTATEGDVQGDAVLTVTARGVPTIVTLPKITPAAAQVGLSESFYRRLFVPLPGRAVQAGSTWVDTVATTDNNGGTKATVNDVVTSTLVGDTTVDGRTLAHITTTTQRTLSIAGTNEGVEIAQKLSGTAMGSVLWDRERNLLVERYEHTELKGTFDLPGMGLTGLPVSANASGRLVLR